MKTRKKRKLFHRGYRKKAQMETESCAIIILAAGASTRLGRPKQLLPFKNQSLIRHLVAEAKKCTALVLVVTGSCHQEIENELQGEQVLIVENKTWADGMGSSIKEGMRYLKSLQLNAAAVILAVCDQPFVTAALFTAMMDLHKRSAKKIVACSYAGSVGTPVLFEQQYFDVLQQLHGTAGAKKIVLQHQAEVALVPFPQGAIDIDTEEDYIALLQQTLLS
jgi:molybdenum cofactor cytidylyltransferase